MFVVSSSRSAREGDQQASRSAWFDSVRFRFVGEGNIGLARVDGRGREEGRVEVREGGEDASRLGARGKRAAQHPSPCPLAQPPPADCSLACNDPRRKVRMTCHARAPARGRSTARSHPRPHGRERVPRPASEERPPIHLSRLARSRTSRAGHVPRPARCLRFDRVVEPTTSETWSSRSGRGLDGRARRRLRAQRATGASRARERAGFCSPKEESVSAEIDLQPAEHRKEGRLDAVGARRTHEVRGDVSSRGEGGPPCRRPFIARLLGR